MDTVIVWAGVLRLIGELNVNAVGAKLRIGPPLVTVNVTVAVAVV